MRVELGVNIAIIDTGRVLLTRREDFRVWCLPGGGVDEGESIAQAAIREAREETGWDVELTRLVGVYSLPDALPGSGHAVVSSAKAISGTLTLDPSEVLEAQFFCADELPVDLIWWHRRRILDALNGIQAVAYMQQPARLAGIPPVATRQEIYAMRDRGELSVDEVYRWTCVQPEPLSEVRDL